MRERADRSRQLADGDHIARAAHAHDVARQLRIPERELEAECHGLGVHAMGPADHRRQPMLLGAGVHGPHQALETLENQIAGFAHLQRLRGVDDVG